jgi:hypothetical protein
LLRKRDTGRSKPRPRSARSLNDGKRKRRI